MLVKVRREADAIRVGVAEVSEDVAMCADQLKEGEGPPSREKAHHHVSFKFWIKPMDASMSVGKVTSVPEPTSMQISKRRTSTRSKMSRCKL